MNVVMMRMRCGETFVDGLASAAIAKTLSPIFGRHAMTRALMTRPLSELRGPIRALFSDVDGTMTTGEAVEAQTYAALERLGAAGIPVIMVTGRPAGFGHAFMKMTPVL